MRVREVVQQGSAAPPRTAPTTGAGKKSGFLKGLEKAVRKKSKKMQFLVIYF
jgi:hypothetical protein